MVLYYYAYYNDNSGNGSKRYDSAAIQCSPEPSQPDCAVARACDARDSTISGALLRVKVSDFCHKSAVIYP